MRWSPFTFIIVVQDCFWLFSALVLMASVLSFGHGSKHFFIVHMMETPEAFIYIYIYTYEYIYIYTYEYIKLPAAFLQL